MVRKKHNKRASKYSLEKETDLTHFGKSIGEMSKYEIKQAYVGSGDEKDEEPFSYDQLIANSKDMRAAARRQKMEAEAELDELNSTFKHMFRSLERRDIHQDKMDNGKITGEDDIAFLARSFMTENLTKAAATDRTVTQLEIADQLKTAARKSQRELSLAAGDNIYDEDEAEEFGNETLNESYHEDSPIVPASPERPSSDLISLIDHLRTNPTDISSSREQLVELAHKTSSSDIENFFISELFNAVENKDLILMKIASIIFPLNFARHSISVPILKLLENMAISPDATLTHLVLLFEYLVAGPKYSPAFFQLAGKLYRSGHEKQVTRLLSEYCEKFTRESLDGVLKIFIPEIVQLLPEEDFIPMQMHTFKPVEVLCLDPAYHEDGEQWTGEHKEMRAAKKLKQQVKADKRLTAKEMRREALATESFHAIEKNKEKMANELARKRNIAKMNDAEANYKFCKTDNGQEPTKKMKSNKNKAKGRK